MAMTKVGRFWFDYDRVDEVLEELMEVPVDRFTVSKNSEDKIRTLLGLDELEGEMELRAVRNAVVDRIGEMINEAAEVDDTEVMFSCQQQISGITAVIDNELWKRGYEV